ncbi:MAG: M48 family metalloprotease [Bacteriovoracaceae bacterium]|nr:M48 family metalloprotease [Bacteriovoracaceae bacterium]
MRLLNYTIALALLAPHFAFAGKMNLVRIKVSPDLQGKIEGRLELTKGLFSKTFQTIELNNLQTGVTEIPLNKAENIKNVKTDIRLKSSANLNSDDQEVAHITGTIKPGDGFSGEELEIESQKFKADIDCSNVFRSSSQGSVLEIDLTSFKNLSSCGGKDASIYSPFGIGSRKIDEGSNWFSMADDERMGREYAEQFISENQGKIFGLDHPTTRYMQEKMELIAKNSDMPNLKPKVRVINADVLNAFALPGGYVFVFRGLMEKSPSEAALMGVLGHEWAHVTARHGTRGMTRSLKTLTTTVTIALIAQVWAEVTEDKVKKIVLPLIGVGTIIGGQLRLLSKGREQEAEADRIGSQYALLAGYHPRGIGDMFEVFKRESGGSSTSLEKILSSHPDHDSRIQMNHILSSLFYPVRVDYVTTSVGYEEAVIAMNSDALPNADTTLALATAFVNGLQKQQEDTVTKYMEGYVSNMMKDRTKPAAK